MSRRIFTCPPPPHQGPSVAPMHMCVCFHMLAVRCDFPGFSVDL